MSYSLVFLVLVYSLVRYVPKLKMGNLDTIQRNPYLCTSSIATKTILTHTISDAMTSTRALAPTND